MSDVRWALPTSVTREQLAEGMVLYDSTTEQVHCLTGPATVVLGAVDSSTVAEIAARTGLMESEVAAYLGELADAGLVTAESTGPELARRSLAKVAAGAAVTLGVWSIVAPTPAAADSYA
ncbi:MAG: hypothetical protein KBB39_13055 [Phycicoccus sp.]|nr:hypothetical protein [Phycicoccus sp.]